MSGPVLLVRDCPAVLVPGGQPVTLARDTQVVVVQALGASVTVRDALGRLARVAADAAGAAGLTAGRGTVPAPAGGSRFSMEAVTEALKTVYDPEIPINVVDLGLVYRCDPQPLADGTFRVEIEMSMTAPGCGMGDVLREDARRTVAALPGVSAVDVELVWDPPWDLSRLSEDARLELGMW